MNSSAKSAPSPYVIGSAIGLLNVASFLTTKKGIGITSAFEDAIALAERKFAPRMTRINTYLKERDDVPKIDRETFLVAGVLLGSALAARGTQKTSDQPIEWKNRFGDSGSSRYLPSFLGAALMMFGARAAKGCTSGHGITGTSQLALSSWVFTPLIFLTALASAKTLYVKGVSHES